MKRFLMFCAGVLALAALPAAAQNPSPTADTSQPPSITARDQLSLDGTVVLDSVFSPLPGWVAVHAMTPDGQPGPVIGIAPVQGGINQNVKVSIDVGGASPQLTVALHEDTNQVGVFENSMMPSADPPVQNNGQPVQASFAVTAILVFDQMVMNDTVVAASVVSAQGGWLVIHADNGGQPGPVLGEWLLQPGTNPAVRVPVMADGRTPIVWPMLHVDDGQIGVYEFDGQSGLDNPIVLNNQVATTSFNLTDQQTVMAADGQPLPTDPTPFLSVFNQAAGAGDTRGILLVSAVYAPTAGWVDVHADAGGHPGKHLGAAEVVAGASVNVSAGLDAQAVPNVPPTTLPVIVWPMLHVDTGVPHIYEYLMVPGADLPVILNGAVLTYPVSIAPGGPEVTATPEVTVEPTLEATPEMTGTPDVDETETPEATESTPEATDVFSTPEATEPSTGGPEPTVEVTQPSGGGPVVEPTAEATTAA
jgi:hypothetical protein